jgi:SAM-dependent methyltransferase
MKKILRTLVHIVFGSHKVEREIKRFAKGIHNKDILEIGSGKNSAKRFFDKTNGFVMSDIKPQAENCRKLDVLKLKETEKYDIIVCVNVLDDIFNYQKAVDNVHKALRKNGKLFFIVNGFYPLHDLPNDYWRFTEASLKKIFSKFSELNVRKIGIEHFPSYYVLEAGK